MLRGIAHLPEFDGHKFVSFIQEKESGLRGVIAIHHGGSTKPAFGATRQWKYNSELEALRDVLRLSKTMSYKAALAGLRYGGAKGVIFNTESSLKKRNQLLKAYAEHVNFLGGRFITGADVGVNREDVKIMRRTSPFIVGFNVNPVKSTALGVLSSIQVCLKELYGSEEIRGRSFAIQGLGKTGTELLKLIYGNGGETYASDIESDKIRATKRMFPKVRIVKPSEIYKRKVDVYSPCALSNCINHANVSELRCKIVAGSANNQLENAHMGELLHKLGILYAPDYIVNAGGLISVVDEYENKKRSGRRVAKRVKNIKRTLRKILNDSKKRNRATNLIADEMAKTFLNS